MNDCITYEDAIKGLVEWYAPTPHYLISLKFEVLKEGKEVKLEGSVNFPREDETIRNRGHVNQAHFLYAAWNISFLVNQHAEMGKLLAVEVLTRNMKELMPGVSLTFEGLLVAPETRKDLGKFDLTFHHKDFWGDVRPVCEFENKFAVR